MELFNYLLKVSACSALFFAFYLLVLRKLTFFKINRFYLLGSLLISFIIPALQFTVEREVEQAVSLNESVTLPQVDMRSSSIEATPTMTNAQVVEPEIERVNWFTLLPYLYASVVASLLLLAAWRIFLLLKHTKASVKEINGLKLVAKEKGFTNCSFFNYVFIDENSLTENELAVLLAHEEVHAKQYHSIDKLMLMLAKAVLWFNPIVYLYDKALEQAHEYEADETTSETIGTEHYAHLLLKLAVSKSSSPLLHSFVKSPIKQRIKMLFNSKSKGMKKLAYLLALPMALGLVWLLAVEVVYANDKVSTKNNSFFQDKPFVERVKTRDKRGYLYEKITINSPGKPLWTGTGFQSKEKIVSKTLWFYINGKLYTEAEVQKFNAAFVKGLSTNKGMGFSNTYDIPRVNASSSNFNLVFWIGTEPKLSEYAAKNRAIWQKYNGTTVSGTVVEYSYSPSGKLMDGFILKTNEGVLLKAFVEAKFVKQANAMISKGEQVTIKIYNAAYWKDNSYPVLSSFKLMKGDKVLFDRWPKMASRTTSGAMETSALPVGQKVYAKPILYSASSTTINHKTKVTHLIDAKMKVFDGDLEAKEVEIDMNKEIITAKQAKFKTEKGNILESEVMTFNQKTGGFTSTNPLEKQITSSAAFDFLSKLSFPKSDSIRVAKIMGTGIILTGNVKMKIDDYVINARVVSANKNSNLITAYFGSLTTGDQLLRDAEMIEFDVVTKEFTVKQVVAHKRK